MTQEDKQLLLNDLCAKLPYGIKVNINNNILTVNAISKNGIISVENGGATNMYYVEDVKPYLFPAFLIPLEELKEYWAIMDEEYCTGKGKYKQFDWINAHHLDFRGLIAKGLAIDCTNLNIY